MSLSRYLVSRLRFQICLKSTTVDSVVNRIEVHVYFAGSFCVGDCIYIIAHNKCVAMSSEVSAECEVSAKREHVFYAQIGQVDLVVGYSGTTEIFAEIIVSGGAFFALLPSSKTIHLATAVTFSSTLALNIRRNWVSA